MYKESLKKLIELGKKSNDGYNISKIVDLLNKIETSPDIDIVLPLNIVIQSNFFNDFVLKLNNLKNRVIDLQYKPDALELLEMIKHLENFKLLFNIKIGPTKTDIKFYIKFIDYVLKKTVKSKQLQLVNQIKILSIKMFQTPTSSGIHDLNTLIKILALDHKTFGKKYVLSNPELLAIATLSSFPSKTLITIKQDQLILKKKLDKKFDNETFDKLGISIGAHGNLIKFNKSLYIQSTRPTVKYF